MKYIGGAHVQHHALEQDDVAGVDEALIEELHGQGLVSITYHEHSMTIVPTPQGRDTAAEYERSHTAEPTADIGPLLEAVSTQQESENTLAWPAVRPVLAALRDYWANSGYPKHGIAIRPLLAAVPDERVGLFAATVKALVAGDYLRPGGNLALNDLPAELLLTDRARTILDGWPGARPEELVENLLAVLANEARQEQDPGRRTRLERVGSTIKELGVSTASEVIAKVITGGT